MNVNENAKLTWLNPTMVLIDKTPWKPEQNHLFTDNLGDSCATRVIVCRNEKYVIVVKPDVRYKGRPYVSLILKKTRKDNILQIFDKVVWHASVCSITSKYFMHTPDGERAEEGITIEKDDYVFMHSLCEQIMEEFTKYEENPDSYDYTILDIPNNGTVLLYKEDEETELTPLLLFHSRNYIVGAKTDLQEGDSLFVEHVNSYMGSIHLRKDFHKLVVEISRADKDSIWFAHERIHMHCGSPYMCTERARERVDYLVTAVWSNYVRGLNCDVSEC